MPVFFCRTVIFCTYANLLFFHCMSVDTTCFLHLILVLPFHFTISFRTPADASCLLNQLSYSVLHFSLLAHAIYCLLFYHHTSFVCLTAFSDILTCMQQYFVLQSFCITIFQLSLVPSLPWQDSTNTNNHFISIQGLMLIIKIDISKGPILNNL